MAEKCFTNKGTNWKYRNLNKWRGNRQIAWKWIQNNDSKDDQKLWKWHGENARINEQAPSWIEESTHRHNTITEFKNTLEGIKSRVSEAENG